MYSFHFTVCVLDLDIEIILRLEASQSTLSTWCSSSENGEKYRSILRFVYVCACFFLCAHERAQEVLIQLAFKALINCYGIWLFSVNAISHAECLANGCRPMEAQHRPFFSFLTLYRLSLLSFLSLLPSAPLPSPPPLLHKRLAVLSQQEWTHEWNDLIQLRCPHSWQFCPERAHHTKA